MHAKRLLVVLTLGMCLLFAAGCAQQTKPTSSEDNTKPGQTEQAASTKNNAPADTSLDPLASITSSSRVVALSRSVGEMWLLAGGQLVGTTDDALDLPSLAGDCVSIGTLSKPSLEQVVACEPDLVMLTEDLSVHKELHQSLDEAGIPVLVVNIDSFDDYDMLFLPGGMPGTKNLRACEPLCDAVIRFVREGRDVAAICAAPSILAELGLLEGRRATSNPGFTHVLAEHGATLCSDPVVVDGNVMTSQGLGTALELGLSMIRRFQGQEATEAIKGKVVYIERGEARA